jgi:hypothetical protein
MTQATIAWSVLLDRLAQADGGADGSTPAADARNRRKARSRD